MKKKFATFIELSVYRTMIRRLPGNCPSPNGGTFY